MSGHSSGDSGDRAMAVGTSSLGSTPVSPHRMCALSDGLNPLNLPVFRESCDLLRFAEKNRDNLFKVSSPILGA